MSVVTIKYVRLDTYFSHPLRKRQICRNCTNAGFVYLRYEIIRKIHDKRLIKTCCLISIQLVLQPQRQKSLCFFQVTLNDQKIFGVIYGN